MTRIAIIGNCQGLGIANDVRAIGDADEVKLFARYKHTQPGDLDAMGEEIKGFDHVFSQILDFS